MSLTETINNDLKTAMKAGDPIRLNTVRSIRALLIELSKKGTGPVSPEEEIGALIAASKKRKEALEMYDKAGRKDLADNERAELEIIQSYLPKQLSETEVAERVAVIIKETGAAGSKDFGKVMPLAMKEFKGKADGAVVQRLVRAALGS